MGNILTKKLERYIRLSSEDKAMLDAVVRQRVRVLPARFDLIREGDVPGNINLILDGWACRYKVFEDGRRQILAILLPGDLCDLNNFVLKHMDHSISTLTPVTYAEITREALYAATLDRPEITQAMWRETLVQMAVQREWSVSLGQRTALERVAHLFCELFLRLKAVGMTEGKQCAMPLTQADLAHATGLSTVHVNRTLQELRRLKLISFRRHLLTIDNLEELKSVALFNAAYLHLDYECDGLDSGEP